MNIVAAHHVTGTWMVYMIIIYHLVAPVVVVIYIMKFRSFVRSLVVHVFAATA